MEYTNCWTTERVVNARNIRSIIKEAFGFLDPLRLSLSGEVGDDILARPEVASVVF